MRILASAYACRPDSGSEEGNGWHLAHQLTRFGEVWVLTPSHNRAAIEAVQSPVQFVYVDVPGWPAESRAANRLRRSHYSIWQRRIISVAKQLHREHCFDVAHHLTYGQYWTGSWMGGLGIPFVWGPVGGGESAPAPLVATLPPDGRSYERKRDLARWVGRRSPAVRSARSRAALILATTDESKQAMQSLPATRVRASSRANNRDTLGAAGATFEVFPNCALSEAEFRSLATAAREPDAYRLTGVGRLEHWKGFQLAIAAMPALVAAVPYAELHIVGTGPAEQHLRGLVASLRLERNVKFLGRIPRSDVLARLADSHAFVLPSFHDSGGWATLEAAAIGLPVVCLDIGGPALQVTSQTGIKISVRDAEQVVPLIAQALTKLAVDPRYARELGTAGRQRVGEHFTWDRLGDRLATLAPYSTS